jgi:hypothetical protein
LALTPNTSLQPTAIPVRGLSTAEFKRSAFTGNGAEKGQVHFQANLTVSAQVMNLSLFVLHRHGR